MVNKVSILDTADGSTTLYVEDINETYHSRHGAIAESWHVYIESGLRPAYFKNTHELRVLEFGFGTGLNALLTLVACASWAPEKKLIHYTTIEKYPIQADVLNKLNYPSHYPDFMDHFNKIHISDWGITVAISDSFFLKKIQEDFRLLSLSENYYDVVYFDAFAPAKQPELWTSAIFENIFKAMKDGGILTTYSAKTEVRNTLAGIGFKVQKLPGPPGKREIIMAVK